MSTRRNVEKWSQPEVVDLPTHQLLAFHRGWIDAQHGRWSSDYDRMSEGSQMAYESGRAGLCNVIAAGLPVPRWNGSPRSWGPVNEALCLAQHLIGHPEPEVTGRA